MPDTDDDQSVELEPDQREQGDDDTEAARERRAAKARSEAGKQPTHDLADEVAEAKVDEADEKVRADGLEERATKDQQELVERRGREDLLDATAETTRALQLAHADEEARDRYRQYATNDLQRATGDRAHGRHELDEAAEHPDEPGSAGLAAEGRRFQNAATIEERKYRGDSARAKEYDASAQDHHREAAESQPSASEAVRNAPEEAPEAQLPQARRHVRGRGRVRNKQGKAVKPNRSSEPDLEL